LTKIRKSSIIEKSLEQNSEKKLFKRNDKEGKT
jgi:hypothetical protein